MGRDPRREEDLDALIGCFFVDLAHPLCYTCVARSQLYEKLKAQRFPSEKGYPVCAARVCGRMAGAQSCKAPVHV
jgi:hypothetical protein